MNDRIVFKSDGLNRAQGLLTELERNLEDAADRMAAIDTSAQWWTRCRLRTANGQMDARSVMSRLSQELRQSGQRSGETARAVGQAVTLFENAERKNCGGAGAEESTFWSRFVEEFRGKFGLDEALSGSNYVKKIISLARGFGSINSWSDLIRTGIDAKKFISSAVKEWGRYMKVGRMVGKGKATWWYVRNALGLKPLGRTSTAKNPIARLKGNLFNKTSPFNIKTSLNDMVGDFAGKNGAGTAVAAWAGVLMDGISNYKDNRAEQAASGGTMSDSRVWAETITETAVGTVISYTATAAVGAVVATAVGSVAGIPAILIAGGTSLVVAGVQSGVKAATGKTVTEWVSDSILDGAEALSAAQKNARKTLSEGLARGAKGLGDMARQASQSVCGWWKNLSYA